MASDATRAAGCLRCQAPWRHIALRPARCFVALDLTMYDSMEIVPVHDTTCLRREDIEQRIIMLSLHTAMLKANVGFSDRFVWTAAGIGVGVLSQLWAHTLLMSETGCGVGCSKTLLGRAVAGEAGLNFLSVKSPDLFSKFVGESEKAVVTLFNR